MKASGTKLRKGRVLLRADMYHAHITTEQDHNPGHPIISEPSHNT
jgi:hypothetical protein